MNRNKGRKFGKCPFCGKKGLCKYNTRWYVGALCRYCYCRVTGWVWLTNKKPHAGFVPIEGRKREREIINSIPKER